MTLPKWAEAQLDLQERSIDKLKEMNRKLSDEASRVVRQANELMEVAASRLKEIDCLHETLDARDEEVVLLNVRLKQRDEEILILKDAARSAEHVATSWSAKLSDKDMAIDRLNDKIRLQDNSIKGLQDELNAARAMLAASNTALETQVQS